MDFFLIDLLEFEVDNDIWDLKIPATFSDFATHAGIFKKIKIENYKSIA